MAFDWQQLLQLAPLALAKPGSQEAAAMMHGYLQSKQRIEQQQRQQGLDARQGDYQQAQMRNMEADNVRVDQQALLDRLTRAQGALMPWAQQLSETATDPEAAQQQLATHAGTLEQSFGVPPGQLAAMVPPIAPAISARKKRQAKELYEQAEKRFGPEAMATDSITLQSELFGDMKPSALRQMFETPAITAQGQPAAPVLPTESGQTTERMSLRAYARERGKTVDQLSADELFAFRKRYQQADDRPQTGATVVIQTVDAQGNPVTRIVPKTPGAEFAVPPTGSQRSQVAENDAVTTGLTRLRELAPDTQTLAQWVGPVQGRVNAAKLVTPGIDVDPTMAEFFAEAAAIKNRMIRAITGAQMSEPEAARIMAQLPDITNKPSVFLARLAATERNLAALNQAIATQSGRELPQSSPAARPSTRRPIPGIPDGEAELRDGRWIRVK